MRISVLIGLLLVALGVLALMVPSITFFTHRQAVYAGFFTISWQQPHTIVLNPAVGLVALAVGVVLLVASRRPSAL